jgi:hypothetical protein
MPRKTSAVMAVAPADQAMAVVVVSDKEMMKLMKADLKAKQGEAKTLVKQIAAVEKGIAKLDAKMLKAAPKAKA